MNVGPSKVGPLYGVIFAERYRPPPGVRIWTPDVLTFYATSMPGMVCLFEVAFDNGLRVSTVPLHKRGSTTFQHLSFPTRSQRLGYFGRSIGFFRDRGLGVPSMALLLHLFSPKDTTEGFLYLSRCSRAPLVVFDLPSSHRSWKGRFFFVSGFNWEYNPSDRDDTLGVPTAWNAPDNLREYLRCFRYDLSEGD